MLRWSERQRAMLKAMGVQQFWPKEVRHETLATDQSAGATAQPEPLSPAIVQVVAAPSPASVRPTAGANARQVAEAIKPNSKGIRPVADGLDWPALVNTVAACQACGLCQQRKQAVIGAGHPRAHWMLVGEAPGEQEDLHGEPFVGRAGQLLDHMLAASRLTREPGNQAQQVYIANAVKCRPPGNRNPTPEEIYQCEPYLLRQVQLVQPKVVVAMGRFAAHTLLKTTEPIGRLRGRVHQYEGIPLVVTYHPAYLLRNPADKALAWDDWCLARELMTTLT
jgi:uracil-DNA glycosylase